VVIFDNTISVAQCARNVIKNVRPGSVVVFHDSEKAFPRMKEALPRVLEYFSKKDYRFDAIGL
jgi:hypothetical protein